MVAPSTQAANAALILARTGWRVQVRTVAGIGTRLRATPDASAPVPAQHIGGVFWHCSACLCWSPQLRPAEGNTT